MPKPTPSAKDPASSRRAGSPHRRRAPLTRERIVAAALKLVAREGIEAFSLRRLGAALHCEAMSLYHFFPSKQHLVDALVDHAIGSLPPPDPRLPSLARLRRLCHDYREMAHRYAPLFPVIAVHRLNTPTGVAFIERTLSAVREVAGDDERAARLFRAIGYYLMGTGLDETAGYAKGPSAAEPVSGEYIAAHCPQLARSARYFAESEWTRTFDFGLDTLLAQFAERPAAGKRQAPRK